MSTLTIRAPDARLGVILRTESKRRGESINKIVLEALTRSFLGDSGSRAFHDLDHLGGTWTDSDFLEFEKATEGLGSVDLDDWK